MDEINYAKILANRIIHLGSISTTKLTETSTCSFSFTPKNRADLKRIVELALEDEIYAIEKYN